MGGDSHLDHAGARRPHVTDPAVECRRHPLEVVRRQDDTRRVAADQIGESRLMRAVKRRPLDIDEFGAVRDRALEDPVALLFRPGETSALPFRAAGHDDGMATVPQRPGDVHVLHAVEAQLDHVGSRRGVACCEQIGHRTAGDGFAQERGHKKTPPQPGWLKRRWFCLALNLGVLDSSRGPLQYAVPYHHQQLAENGRAKELNGVFIGLRVEGRQYRNGGAAVN
jgi:hypothetical protein